MAFLFPDRLYIDFSLYLLMTSSKVKEMADIIIPMHDMDLVIREKIPEQADIRTGPSIKIPWNHMIPVGSIMVAHLFMLQTQRA